MSSLPTRDDDGRILLYHRVKRRVLMDTQWGEVPGEVWLYLERKRINDAGGDAIIKEVGGNMQLWVIPSAVKMVESFAAFDARGEGAVCLN